MREIKFRAWSHLWKEAAGVLPVLTIDFVNRAIYVLPERELEGGNQEEWLFGEIDLMQYTGLKDKNGKEIYEGDIIAWDYEYDSDYDGDMPIVKRSTGKAVVKDIFDRSRIFSAEEEGKGVEVIGNIYENPELLKNETQP